jgi:hypothetical protein
MVKKFQHTSVAKVTTSKSTVLYLFAVAVFVTFQVYVITLFVVLLTVSV